MGDKVKIEVHTDKRDKDHINIYDGDPKDLNHSSIHINIDTNTGTGNIVDTTNGTKEVTDIKCFLTTACMRRFKENFDDNCYELTMLRWLRDNVVSREDIEHYYEIAPIIVEKINNESNSNVIYNYIYDNVICKCIKAIEQKKYASAYIIYKNGFLALEEAFVVSSSLKNNIKVKKYENKKTARL